MSTLKNMNIIFQSFWLWHLHSFFSFMCMLLLNLAFGDSFKVLFFFFILDVFRIDFLTHWNKAPNQHVMFVHVRLKTLWLNKIEAIYNLNIRNSGHTIKNLSWHGFMSIFSNIDLNFIISMIFWTFEILLAFFYNAFVTDHAFSTFVIDSYVLDFVQFNIMFKICTRESYIQNFIQEKHDQPIKQ